MKKFLLILCLLPSVGFGQYWLRSDSTYYLASKAWVKAQIGSPGGISATPPITYSVGVIGITQSSGSSNGYLSSANWTTFNNKQNALTFPLDTSLTQSKVRKLIAGFGISLNPVSGIGDVTVTADTSVAGGGITHLNGLNATTQFFALDTTSGNAEINSSGSTHTFRLPLGDFPRISQYLAVGKSLDSTRLAYLGKTNTFKKSQHIDSSLYGVKYFTRNVEDNRSIGTLPVNYTWQDAGYANVFDSTGATHFQPQILKQGSTYYVFYELQATGYVSGVNKFRIAVAHSISLSGSWTNVDSILVHGTTYGNPDFCFVADPNVLYIPWAEHKWHMWFSMAQDTIVQTTTVGHAWADNPLGPWTKQATAGVTNIVIGKGTSSWGYDKTTIHAPKMFIYGGVVHALVNVQGIGHTGFDIELAIASDNYGLGYSFEKYGPVTTDSSLVTGDADRLNSLFTCQNVLYGTISNVDGTKEYFVASHDGGKSWIQVGEVPYPFYSFLVEDNKIWGLTGDRSAWRYPIKLFYLDLENLSGSVLASAVTTGGRTGLLIYENAKVGYMANGDTRLYRSAAGVWNTESSLGVGNATVDSSLTGTGGHFTRGLLVGARTQLNGPVGIGTSVSASLMMFFKEDGTHPALFGFYRKNGTSPLFYGDTLGRFEIGATGVISNGYLTVGSDGTFDGSRYLYAYLARAGAVRTFSVDTSGDVFAGAAGTTAQLIGGKNVPNRVNLLDLQSGTGVSREKTDSSGNKTIGGTLAIGGGSILSKFVTTSLVYDCGSIAAGVDSTFTITATGAVAGNPVQLGVSVAAEAGLIMTAECTTNDVVRVRISNHFLVSAVDPASRTYKVLVTNF